MKHTVNSIAIGLVLCMAFWSSASGQGTSGSILGTVYDESRAVLPGVAVTATNQGTGQRRTSVTNDRGQYQMAQMTVGKYRVQAELPGFQMATRDITLTLEADVVSDFTLTVGEVTTEIMVTAEAPLVDTTSSALRKLVDEQQIQDLPLNGRSFTDLVMLQSGVTRDFFASQASVGLEGARLMISGTRSRQSLFQVDGADIRNHRGSTPGSIAGVQLGVDTIQEFTVITGVASAEYGGMSGGVVTAVSKSGTNEFHGTVFAFHRNDALDARNFFDRDPDDPLVRSDVPPFKRNQYGFTLGGPIQRDKVFFFTTFEGLNERLTVTETASVPGLDARNGLIPEDGQFVVDPLIQPILDAWPLPNSTIRSDGTADYIYPGGRKVDQQFIVGKVDWLLSDADTISGRYTLDNATRDRPNAIDVVFDESVTRTQLYMLEWKRVFSPNLVNQARVSFNRFRVTQDYSLRKPLPDIMHFNKEAVLENGDPWHGQVVVPNVASLGASSQFITRNVLNKFQYTDNLTYTRGTHSLKTGFNIIRFQLNNATAQRLTGIYRWSSLEEFITLAPGGIRDYRGTLTGLTPLGRRQYHMGFYLQDDWRVRPNLTLNLGVRYEPWTVTTEVAGRTSNCRDPNCSELTVGLPYFGRNPSLKNFAPRAGIAWDPFEDGKTSIRAGYGLFYEPFSTSHYWGSPTRNAPIVIEVALEQDVTFPDPFENIPDLSQVLTVPWLFTDTNLAQGGVHQYQLSIQRELVPNLVLKAEYTGSRGYNLAHLVDTNTAIPQTDANGVYPYYPANSVRRNPNFGRMRDTAWDASSWYNALGITLTKRYGNGFSLQGAYTFGKSIDNNSSSGTSESRSGPNGLSTFTEDVDFDHALSDFDVRNRLTVNGAWDIPFVPGNAILGGWRLSGILTIANGARGDVDQSRNQSRSRQTQDVPDRPSLIPGGDNNPVLDGGREPTLYMDPSQFILGPPGYFGKLGRNTIEFPGAFVLDFAIHKDFHFDEERYLQFRAELFNAVNRANFYRASDTRFTSSGRNSSTFGRITETSTTSRQVQLALKLHF